MPLTHPRPGREDRRSRYGLLLSALVVAFAIEGVATPAPWEQALVSALLGATLVLAFWVADARPAMMRLAGFVSVCVFAASVIEAANGTIGGAATLLANLLLVVLAPPFVVLGVMRTMRARAGVTIESVFGVLCLYILIGMGFALIYGAIARLSGSFFAHNVDATTARCLYFSFTTLTTVGYGDLTASSNLGHTLSVTEALVGQIYLVTIVSVMVGNLRRRTVPQD